MNQFKRRSLAIITVLSLMVSQQFALLDLPVAQAGALPVADFSINPGTGPVTAVFQLDASISSDPEDGTGAASAIQVRWDFENDGAFDTGFTTIKTANKQYDSAGTKTVKLEVKDTEGQTDSIQKQIVVTAGAPGNNLPTAAFTIDPANAEGSTATIFTFNASTSSDQEDGTGAASPLLVRWDFEDDGTFDTGFSTTKTVTHVFNTNGPKTVRLEVRDTAGDSSSTTQNVTIGNSGQGGGPNTAPVADFTINPATGDTTTQFTFDAAGTTDVQDGTGAASAIEVRWDFNNDGTFYIGFRS